MQITLDSFNAHTLTDGINTNAYLPDDSGIIQQAARAVYVPRHLMAPLYGTVTFDKQIRTLLIEFLQDDPAYWDTVKGWFDVMADAEYKLLGHDQNNKQWYLMAKVFEQQPYKNSHLIFKLAVGDGVWRSETLNSDTTWNITASGNQHTISPTVGGNVNAYPTIRISPTSAKTGASSFAYRRLSRIYSQSVNAAQRYPFDITHGGWDSAAVIADTAKSNQVNLIGGIGTGLTPFAIDTAVGGGLPSSGMAYLDTEQISYTISGSTLTPTARGLNGTTAATHADNTMIKWSRMQADGGDVRVLLDGAEVDYWFGTGANGINQAATKIWINLFVSPKIELTLSGALGAGALTLITVANTAANKAALKVLPPSGRLMIDNEVFYYAGHDNPNRTITIGARAINNTTAATHVDGSTIRWLEHEVWLLFGNQSIEAATVSDVYKPIFDLTSTNISWVYTVFTDSTGVRPGSWTPSILDTNARANTIQTAAYTGDHTANADPATELGMKIASFQYGRTWKAENAQVEWRLTHPFGVTDVTSSGEKFRNTSSWPAAAADLQYSANGTKWKSSWQEATGTLNTWDAWTHNGVALGATYRFIRFFFRGVQAGSVGGYAGFEVNGATLTLPSAAVPTGALDAEVSSYELDCKITHVGSGHYVALRRQIDLAEYVELDGDIARVTYSKDGSHGPKPVLDENRPHYLELLPGVANVLQFDDVGTSGVTVSVYWRDRMN